MNGVLCPTCAGQTAQIDGTRSAFRFEGVVREMVHQLKYKNLKAIAPLMATLMQEYLVANPIPGDILVPVPLHGRRLRERGYNQSYLLARSLSTMMGLPVVDNCLVRERPALPQAKTANVEERRSNVAGAFGCHKDTVRNRQALLVDDVCTSGATLEACAVALKAGGATSVWGLTFAREI